MRLSICKELWLCVDFPQIDILEHTRTMDRPFIRHRPHGREPLRDHRRPVGFVGGVFVVSIFSF